jgi:predicted hotdog family 3-hydroxylacyl-ACP dehydratase
VLAMRGVVAISAVFGTALAACAEPVAAWNSERPVASVRPVEGGAVWTLDPHAATPDRVPVELPSQTVAMIDAWLNEDSMRAGSSPVLFGAAAATAEQPIVVPLPSSLTAGLATLGALAGSNYLRRRRIERCSN